MADNSKRVNCVKVCFTDRQFIDLGRLAATQNRKVADLVWSEMIIRMYGMVVPGPIDEQGTNED